ncbi:MAG TPA: NB-ARC domain-containing protein [Candidatus Baltobacteraceae bacterium]|nr:NB-ARC domain-containing protein [Candidatus Baltobacteraceae bacterium]
MSSFTPRVWKSQPDRTVEAPAGKFHAHHLIRPDNLPIARTSFIGRERDVAEVKELLDRRALVTLAGSGGVGKTRLALQVGTELIDRYPDGVWFVDLAPLSDPELVYSVTAQALGMNQQADRPIDQAISAWLKRKKLLLIFDNCEHVVAPVAALTASILHTAPDVRVLATSRHTLEVGGEAAYRVSSLEVREAIALFVDRATAADTRFTLTNDIAPIVADMCRRLDGIPLAIELAAARVKVLTIPHLAERLNERFKILTGGSRDALPRQKTLTALIDWSYDLLTPQEQLFFARLGIFAGGFGIDAATNVCGGDGLDEFDILDLLGSLTDKSLVVADTSGERERYRLLESTAAYALEKLRVSGDRDALARRHAEFFRAQAEGASERYGTGSIFLWLSDVELELDNDRAALAWALTLGNDAVLGGAIAGALSALWANASLVVEGRYWVGLALERVSEAEQPRVAARLWYALSALSAGKRAHEPAERSMRLYASIDDARWSARAQRNVALALYQMGHLDEAKATVEDALTISRSSQDIWNAALCLDTQGTVELVRGDVRAARELFAQALAAFKALETEFGTSLVLCSMAELEFTYGHPNQALRAISEALEIQLRGKNATLIAISHNNSAAYRIALGDLQGSRESAREGLRMARQVRNEETIAVALQHLSVLAALGGDARRGAHLLGYVDRQYTGLGIQREQTEQWGYDKLIATLRDTLSANEIETLEAEGAAWSEEQAVEEALKA